MQAGAYARHVHAALRSGGRMGHASGMVLKDCLCLASGAR